MGVRAFFIESWALKNGCFWAVVLKKTLSSRLDGKEIKPVNPKRNQPWVFIRRTDAKAETPILWLPEGRRRRGWQRMDGWMASLTQRTWIWARSGSWRWRGRPGVLQSMGSQRVRYDWVTELNWTEPLDGTYAWILVILLKTISILEISHVCELYTLN